MMMTPVGNNVYRWDGKDNEELELTEGHYYEFDDESGLWEEIFELGIDKSSDSC